MRTDIIINTDTHDVVFVRRPISPPAGVRFVEDFSLPGNYVYVEPIVRYSEAEVRKNGLSVEIPYTAVDRPLKIRIPTGLSSYMQNRKDGSVWFVCVDRGSERNVCEYPLINDNCSYRLQFDESTQKFEICSNDVKDFEVGDAEMQNRLLMLQCTPGNSYRYPTTGVGAAKWLNSGNGNMAELGRVMAKQFANDGTKLLDVQYDMDKQKLYIDAVTTD